MTTTLHLNGNAPSANGNGAIVIPAASLERIEGMWAACHDEPGQAPELTARQRLERLCDSGSLQVLRSNVESLRWRDGAHAGDGVITATGSVAGRPVACYAQEGALAGGSLGEAQADSIVRLMRFAGSAGMPLVGFVHCAGARIQEGLAGLAGFARVFHENVALLRRVPQISVVTGACAGGGAYSPALTDFVVMADSAAMFLTGPKVVRSACGEDVTPADLGGPRVHGRNGVCHLVVRSDAEAVARARALLAYLPQAAGDPLPSHEPSEPLTGDPGAHLPDRPAAPYDVRHVARSIVDDSHLLEIAPRWAQNMVVAFARIGGMPVGIVANQPRHMGGVIDVPACEKAARFVESCDAYGIPVVVLVDTPGFMPGSKQEAAGIIYRGARLVEAFAAASVPRFTVVLRKAYGGAYIAMNAKDLGATLTFAWPQAELGIMDARYAVGIAHRRALVDAEDPEAMLDSLARDYASRHCGAASVAREGFVDEVIEPSETRARLRYALAAFEGRVRLGYRRGV